MMPDRPVRIAPCQRTVPRPFFTSLIVAALFLTRSAEAMEIHNFDQMASADQGEYVAELVQGAQKVLIADGKADLADKVHQLFTKKIGNDQISAGMAEFMINLARARVADANNLVKNPNTRRIEVEDAMAVTLKKNDIILPQSFFTVNNGFKPQNPPQQEKKQ